MRRCRECGRPHGEPIERRDDGTGYTIVAFAVPSILSLIAWGIGLNGALSLALWLTAFLSILVLIGWARRSARP